MNSATLSAQPVASPHAHGGNSVNRTMFMVQLALLPASPRSLVAPPDQQNLAAYQTVGQAGDAEAQGLALKPVEEQRRLAGSGLSDEEWQAYLARVEEVSCNP
jgi:hypothetical protein